MVETPELKAAREATELKEFQGLVNYADRYAYFHSHPYLAKVYCATNFAAAPQKAAEPTEEKK